MTEQILFLGVGVLAGILAGLLGLGGGIIVVPSLNILLASHFPSVLVMHMAVGTSLAVMVFTALSAAYAYHRRKLVLWPLFYKFIPGLLAGTITGSIVARHLSGHILSIAFGFFLLLVATNMLFSKKPSPHRELPQPLFLNIIAFLMGICSGFFGIGGGTMIVPFFVYCNVDIRKAAGTSALCGFPLALTGATTLIMTGWNTVASYSVPPGTTGYVYWPAAVLIASGSLLCAPLGTRIAVWLPSSVLKKVFSILLYLTAINLIMRA
ncbi:MAG TPA: sulfite exporter TauE/SafE family protein [Gammaproteobacteria bacterium]|nr:sulfite exporter TauE/SafE family protein [Gammaproteobacteria bacterium]